MSGITVDIAHLSEDKMCALKNLVGDAAKAKAEAKLQAEIQKVAEAKAKADIKVAYELSDEGIKAAQEIEEEKERLARFKASLDKVEEADCFVVNGQLGNRKIYQVFSSLLAAKQWSKDLVSIGGRVYTREPVSCKMK